MNSFLGGSTIQLSKTWVRLCETLPKTDRYDFIRLDRKVYGAGKKASPVRWKCCDEEPKMERVKMATAWGFAAWESLSRLALGDLFTATLLAIISLRAAIAIKLRVAYDKLSRSDN